MRFLPVLILMTTFSALAAPVDKLEYCLQKHKNKSAEGKGAKLCKDGTISFKQPADDSIAGYEGKCGQTAASNLIYAYCKRLYHPTEDIGYLFRDISPGVMPGSLKDGLNEKFDSLKNSCPKGNWKKDVFANGTSFLAGIKNGLNANISAVNKTTRTRKDKTVVKTTPLAVLIHAGGLDLHWITVMDMYETPKGCRVVYQEIAGQRTIPCTELVNLSRKVGEVYGELIPSYTVIRFK